MLQIEDSGDIASEIIMKDFCPELKRLIVDVLIEISTKSIKRGRSRSEVMHCMSKLGNEFYSEIKNAIDR